MPDGSRRGVLAAVLIAATLGGGAPAALAGVQVGPDRITVSAPAARAVVTRDPVRVRFENGRGRTVLSQVTGAGSGPLLEPPTVDPEPNGVDQQPETTLYAPFTFTVGTETIQQWPCCTWAGNLQSAQRSGIQHSARAVTGVARVPGGVRLRLSTTDPTGRVLLVTLRPRGRRAISVGVRPQPADGIAIVADSFAAGRREAFRGFGGRHNALDQRGNDFEAWVNQSNLDGNPAGPPGEPPPGGGGDRYLFPNGPEGAYFNQSQFVSSRGYGFLSLRDELTRWRMASDRPGAWQVAASAPALRYLVAPGSYRRAIRTLTGITGRHRLPPRWALRPQLDRLVRFPAQSPAEYVTEVGRDLRDIRRYRIPVGAYRIEAWHFFTREQLRHTIRRFHRNGIRVLLYFRAFVGKDEIGTDDPALFDEAVSRGWVATRPSGEPYVFTSNFFAPGAVIDFTDPAALRWWTRRIHEALALGADGFMQDFGEQVFADMRFEDGSTGLTMHNRLPVLFHRATRHAIAGYRRSHPRQGQVYFFTRAGHSGTPGSVAYESATWPGDETTDWTRSSGLASQAPDMLNRGVSGAYGFGTDIGGYFDFAEEPTTKELFLRWAEWAALTPIFRLHGSVGAGTHTPWTYDRATVRAYRRLSRLHLAALPLIHRLWRRAARTGVPIARPLWLAYPRDRRAAAQDQQWLLGPDVLVAPVVREGARKRRVYFPRGCWRNPETGFTARGPRSRTVAAPLARLPYFFRCGRRPFSPPGRA